MKEPLTKMRVGFRRSNKKQCNVPGLVTMKGH